eukprot:9490373-Pyramimonas_sp.AAC.2
MRPSIISLTSRSSSLLRDSSSSHLFLSKHVQNFSSRVRMAFRGPRQELVEARLKKSFPEAIHMEVRRYSSHCISTKNDDTFSLGHSPLLSHTQVTNESHGRQEDESHFHVLLVAEAFEGVNLIGRHRLVHPTHLPCTPLHYWVSRVANPWNVPTAE